MKIKTILVLLMSIILLHSCSNLSDSFEKELAEKPETEDLRSPDSEKITGKTTRDENIDKIINGLSEEEKDDIINFSWYLMPEEMIDLLRKNELGANQKKLIKGLTQMGYIQYYPPIYREEFHKGKKSLFASFYFKRLNPEGIIDTFNFSILTDQAENSFVMSKRSLCSKRKNVIKNFEQWFLNTSVELYGADRTSKIGKSDNIAWKSDTKVMVKTPIERGCFYLLSCNSLLIPEKLCYLGGERTALKNK